MLQCSDCGETFSDDLVQPLCINGDYVRVCGVCALEVIKELHNIPSYQFAPGSTARNVYDRTKAYKREKQEKANQG